MSVEVALDPAAVAAAEAGGGTLDDRVRLGDLPTAGWTVGPWVRAPDGGATITLTQAVRLTGRGRGDPRTR